MKAYATKQTTYDYNLTIRISNRQRMLIGDMANEDGRSIASYIRMLIENDAKRRKGAKIETQINKTGSREFQEN